MPIFLYFVVHLDCCDLVYGDDHCFASVAPAHEVLGYVFGYGLQTRLECDEGVEFFEFLLDSLFLFCFCILFFEFFTDLHVDVAVDYLDLW